MFPLRPNDILSGDLVMVESILTRRPAGSTYVVSFEAKSIALLARDPGYVPEVGELEPDFTSLWML